MLVLWLLTLPEKETCLISSVELIKGRFEGEGGESSEADDEKTTRRTRRRWGWQRSGARGGGAAAGRYYWQTNASPCRSTSSSNRIIIVVYILQVAYYCGRSRKNKFVFRDLQKVAHHPDSPFGWFFDGKLAPFEYFFIIGWLTYFTVIQCWWKEDN